SPQTFQTSRLAAEPWLLGHVCIVELHAGLTRLRSLIALTLTFGYREDVQGYRTTEDINFIALQCFNGFLRQLTGCHHWLERELLAFFCRFGCPTINRHG